MLLLKHRTDRSGRKADLTELDRIRSIAEGNWTSILLQGFHRSMSGSAWLLWC